MLRPWRTGEEVALEGVGRGECWGVRTPRQQRNGGLVRRLDDVRQFQQLTTVQSSDAIPSYYRRSIFSPSEGGGAKRRCCIIEQLLLVGSCSLLARLPPRTINIYWAAGRRPSVLRSRTCRSVPSRQTDHTRLPAPECCSLV